MELSGTGEVRRGGRIISAGLPAAKRETAGLNVNRQRKADRLALSRQVVGYLEERNRQIMEESRKRKTDTPGSSEADLLEKGLKTLNKCQKIYVRVVNGDKVPPEDLRYLEQNDPEGFKMALAMRKPNRHPREWESVLEEEDRCGADHGAEETGGGEAAPSESGGGPAPSEGVGTE